MAELYFKGSLATAIDATRVAIDHVRAGRYTDIHTVDAVMAACGEANAALREHVEPIGSAKVSQADLPKDIEATADSLEAAMPQSDEVKGGDFALWSVLLIQLARLVLDRWFDDATT